MFGYRKLMTAILENLKVITVERVNQTELMARQVAYIRQIANALEAGNEFKRKVFEAQTGVELDGAESESAFNEQRENQERKHDALSELYHADISPGGFEEDGDG